MKEKKIKKKQFHKIPAVILAVFVLVSLLALSAFADCYEYGHTYGEAITYVEYGQTGCYMTCDDCGEEHYYEVSYEVPYCEAECGNYEFSWIDSVEYDGDKYRVIAVYDCDCGTDGASGYWWFREATPPTPTTPNGIAQSITKDITSAIGVFLKGIGSTLVDFFDNVVITTNAEGQRVLSAYAGWTIAFIGIGIGGGLIRKLTRRAG